jgi:hypothetical protein
LFLLSVCTSFFFLPVIAGNPHVNPKCYVLSCSNHFGFIKFVVYESVCMRVCFCVLFWTGLFTFCVVFDLCIVVLLFLFVRVVFFFCVLLGSLNQVARFFIPCMRNGLGLFVSLIFGLKFLLWIFVSCLSRHMFLLFLHLCCKICYYVICAVCCFFQLCDVRCVAFIQWKFALRPVRNRCISTGFQFM